MSQFRTKHLANRFAKNCEKRREVRYPDDNEVIVFCGSEFFKSRTINQSESGIQLLQPLPVNFIGKVLQIMVAIKDDNKKVHESLYEGQSVGRCRDRLQIKKIA